MVSQRWQPAQDGETDANSLALKEERGNILRREEIQRRFWKQKVSSRQLLFRRLGREVVGEGKKEGRRRGRGRQTLCWTRWVGLGLSPTHQFKSPTCKSRLLQPLLFTPFFPLGSKVH